MSAQTRTVIIGVDGSKHSDNAFDFYVRHLHVKGDEIILVHVTEYSFLVHAPAAVTDPMVVQRLIEEEQKEVKKLLTNYVDRLKSNHLGGTVKNMFGKSGESIVALAEKSHAGLIVLGSRGQGMLRRTILGSVSDYVLHHSHIPVMICSDKHNQ